MSSTRLLQPAALASGLLLLFGAVSAPAQVQMTAPPPAYSSSYAYQPGPIEATAGTETAAFLVLGVFGPNTRAVCQAGSAGSAYYTCRQLVTYDLYAGSGKNITDSETVVANDGSVAAQPSGSFYGARAQKDKHRGEASSYCQARTLHGGETACLVDAGTSHQDGAWAKVHFKRSGS